MWYCWIYGRRGTPAPVVHIGLDWIIAILCNWNVWSRRAMKWSEISETTTDCSWVHRTSLHSCCHRHKCVTLRHRWQCCDTETCLYSLHNRNETTLTVCTSSRRQRRNYKTGHWWTNSQGWTLQDWTIKDWTLTDWTLMDKLSGKCGHRRTGHW